MKGKLILDDGTIFAGDAIGIEGEKMGEVVFNTSMTGYQEVISDPSYYGQIVVMTYPLIGNYGLNRDDYEARAPHLFGLIVRESVEFPSNWRSEKNLKTVLKENNILGLAGIDTRMLTKKIRENGTLKGIITTYDTPIPLLLERLKEDLPKDHVAQVSTKMSFHIPNRGKKIVVIDFGEKNGIIRELIKRSCDVVVVPYNTDFTEIKKINPDGVILSNGPGDPKDIPEVLPTIKLIEETYPLFGICLGHQLFALANGGDTQKLKFGHRGGNHPVKELGTNRVFITAQNHGFQVTKDSLSNTELELTHISLNDGSVEGIRHKNYKAFSVQYHPEAAPGPYDSTYLFDQFLAMIDVKRGEKYAEK